MTPTPEVQQRLRRYLLGQLSDDAREEVERDLMSGGDELFQELLIAEDEIIDEYLSGKLDSAERQRFQGHFLATPERHEKLKFGHALSRYLSSHAEDTPERQPVAFEWTRPLFSSPWRVAVAAVILVAIGLGVWRVFFHQSEVDKGLLALNAAYREQRPLESRISSLDYAPYLATRGKGPDKVDQDELSRASLLLHEALKTNRTPQVLHALGQVYLAKKEYDRAIEYFEEALKGGSGNAQLYSDLAAALIEKGANAGSDRGQGALEFARAREHLTKALSLNPRLLEALFNRAVCSEYQLMRRQAKEDWKEYLKADSNSRWAIEARERLRKLEEQGASSSRSSEQLPLDFLAAYQSRNDEAAWAALSRSRTRAGNTIVEALVDEYLRLAKSAQTLEAANALQKISYAGKVELDRIADRFTSDLARFYQRTTPDRRDRLVQTRELIRDARKLYDKGEYESAGEVYLQARDSFVELRDECEALIADSFVGYCALRIPETQKSIETFERLSRESQGRGYRYLFGQTLPSLADAEWSRGEFSKTLDYAARGLKVSAEVQDAALGVRCLAQNISTRMVLGDYQRSLESLSEAVHLADTLGPNPSLTWQLYNQASFDFHFLGFPSSAMAFQQEALHLAIASGSSLQKARTWDQMGVLYGEQKNYDEAIKSGEKAVAEGQNIKGEKSRNNVIARSTLTLGKLHLAAGHPGLAIQNFDESISIYEKLKFNAYFYEARKGKVRALLDIHDDAAAEAELKTVLALFEQNWKKISQETNRDVFFDTGQDAYDIAADFAYSRLNDEKRAFEYAEASRARSLLEMMKRGARVNGNREVPDIDLASHTESLTLKEIQERMPERAQIIEYSLLPDKLIAWVIRKREFKSAFVPLRQSEFERQLQSYRELITRGSGIDAQAQRAAAQELYSILIGRIETDIDAKLPLFIAADKSLHYTFFATLVSPTSGRYLIEDHAIQMIPSASVFVWSSELALKRAGPAHERVLSIGNPNFDQVAFPGLTGLRDAGREASIIGASYPSRTVLIGPDASFYRVTNELKNADVIHFATHAVADSRGPMLSKLLLAANRNDGVNSHHAGGGFLQASEIYQLKLRARLVVLSACQTGIERAYRGEGAIGLARPFLVAGVPIVVASLWPVDSESAAELMIKFHEYRTREHKPTIEALRQAQVHVIHNPSPGSQGNFGWAAFVAIGGYAEF